MDVLVDWAEIRLLALTWWFMSVHNFLPKFTKKFNSLYINKFNLSYCILLLYFFLVLHTNVFHILIVFGTTFYDVGLGSQVGDQAHH